MAVNNNQLVYMVYLGLAVVLIYLLGPILTPFLLGALLAYFSNPLVKRFELWGMPHALAVTLVLLILICIMPTLILTLVPIIQVQTVAFFDELPNMIAWLQNTAVPWVSQYVDVKTVKSSLTGFKPDWVFSTVLKSGNTLISLAFTLVLTPVVTFYFLRDWDYILAKIKANLPLSIKPTVLKLATDCDAVLSEFLRGQLLVMLSLCCIYGLGLTVVGLKMGIFIGVMGGLLTLIPYLGSSFVLIIGTLTAFIQYGAWPHVFAVWVVYLIGQVMEGYVLVPYLIGNRIGLHPVAVIFAIMAGGTLFGFFGVLLALPTAAVIMVILRSFKKLKLTPA